jgi:hypothetical protein
MSEPARRTNGLLLAGVAAGWVVACFFAVALVSAAVGMLAQVVGRPTLATNTVFTVAVEAVVHLLLAVVIFGLARASAPPRWFWVVGPIGYLVAFGLFLAFMLLLGNTNAVPSGAGWAFVVGDIVATALGAWVALRRPPLAKLGELPGPDESAGGTGPLPPEASA